MGSKSLARLEIPIVRFPLQKGGAQEGGLGMGPPSPRSGIGRGRKWGSKKQDSIRVGFLRPTSAPDSRSNAPNHAHGCLWHGIENLVAAAYMSATYLPTYLPASTRAYQLLLASIGNGGSCLLQ